MGWKNKLEQRKLLSLQTKGSTTTLRAAFSLALFSDHLVHFICPFYPLNFHSLRRGSASLQIFLLIFRFNKSPRCFRLYVFLLHTQNFEVLPVLARFPHRWCFFLFILKLRNRIFLFLGILHRFSCRRERATHVVIINFSRQVKHDIKSSRK